MQVTRCYSIQRNSTTGNLTECSKGKHEKRVNINSKKSKYMVVSKKKAKKQSKMQTTNCKQQNQASTAI